MKISELLLEAEEQGKKAPVAAPAIKKSPSNLPSINDEPEDDDMDKDDGVDSTDDPAREFKSDAVSIGDGIYALSAWVYPEAWRGGGYSDILMHNIVTLASDLNYDLGDYEQLNDQNIADGRRIEIIFFNEQTDSMFRLSASGAEGTVEFSPSLADLQSNGSVTNAQMTKLKNIESTVQAWVNSIPEDWEDEPRDRRWQAAERKVTGLFQFSSLDVDDGDYDMDSDQFWSKVDTYREVDAETKKKSDDMMDEYIRQAMAKKASKSGV